METEMIVERYHIKSRGVHMSEGDAKEIGIRRVYNWTSHMDFMHADAVPDWIEGLYDKGTGEAVLVENALRYVNNEALYVSTCIVFVSAEFCNLFYMKNKASYKLTEGFFHLLN